MALNQLPVVESTIQIVHSGDASGGAFTATLDASDGAPVADQQVFTFDLTVFAPDLVGTTPIVEVYLAATSEKVEADVKVESALLTISFFQPVAPTAYRVKVVG